MKTILFSYFILLTTSLFSGFAYAAGASSFNGVSAGKSYKDTKNKNPSTTYRYSADPGVMVYNGRVYVYATNDGDVANKNVSDNTYGQINTINVMSSDDLVNWMDHGPIAAAGSGGAAKWAGNSWAPTAAHKKINGKEKFFVYFANNANGIGVLSSDSPTGPFTDPIGKALISRQTQNCGDVTWLFDPAVLVDDDGTGYLYFGGGIPTGRDANPKTVRVVKLGADMISLAGTPQLIDAPWVFEDSGINKIGNTYYYSYCTNWAGGPYGNARIAYMTSNSPMGPFTYQGTCFNNPGDFFGTTGNNHHTIIEFKNKHYIFYHAEWLNKQVFGSQKGYRTTHVDEMPFSNGKFGQAKGTLTGPTQLKDVDGSALNYAASFAWQSGITIKGQGAVTQVNYGRGAWTGVSNVALGNASSITLKASSQSGATIKICTGSENGQAIGYVEIPAGGSFKTVTGTLSGASGTKNLFFVASGNCSIESWQLDGAAGGNNGDNNNTGGNTEVQQPTEGTADVVDGWYYIKNTGSNKYLTATEAAAGANVNINSFYGDESQKWKVTYNSEGYITLVNGLGDFMLDVANGKNEDNANIIIYNAYGGEAQQYALESAGDKAFFITTRVSNGSKTIDVYGAKTDDGTNVIQWRVTGGSNQTWVFEPVDGGKTNNGNSGNSSGNGNNASTKCWAEALGYSCCSSCVAAAFKDSDGEWGIVNNDWCGIPTSCSTSTSSKQCVAPSGYACCKSSCDVYESDADGDWSIENNDWCFIDKEKCK